MTDSKAPTTDDQASGLEFTEATESRKFLKNELDTKQAQLALLKSDCEPLERANLQLEIAEIMLDISNSGMPEAAWGLAKESFLMYVDLEMFEEAVQS